MVVHGRSPWGRIAPPLSGGKSTIALDLLIGVQNLLLGQGRQPKSFLMSATHSWVNQLDNTLIPVKKGSQPASAVVVAKIIPLYYLLSFDSVETNGITPRYVVGVEHQGAAVPAQRRKQQRFVSPDDPKKDAFTLLQVRGAPENPGELVLKLADTGETVSISPGKPYQRVDAYAADLRYDQEKKIFPAKRVGAGISFANGDYIVVAIDDSEVVLFDQSNQKKTTLRYAP